MPATASLLGLLGLALVACAACSTSSSTACVADGTVTVKVTDEDVDSPTNFVCAATVAITAAGGAPITLTPEGYDGSDANCAYTANVPPGTYTIAASATGYTPGSQQIVIEQADCVTSSPTLMLGLFETQQGQTSPDAGLGGSDAGTGG
jgi:ABC-type glycerol-3-phosphate transport system substrate-binding protein